MGFYQLLILKSPLRLICFFLSLRFQCHTAEAAKLEAEVTKAQETISAAQQLISQLDGEHTRWNIQVV